jgi:hypothetical protein
MQSKQNLQANSQEDGNKRDPAEWPTAIWQTHSPSPGHIAQGVLPKPTLDPTSLASNPLMVPAIYHNRPFFSPSYFGPVFSYPPVNIPLTQVRPVSQFTIFNSPPVCFYRNIMSNGSLFSLRLNSVWNSQKEPSIGVEDLRLAAIDALPDKESAKNDQIFKSLKISELATLYNLLVKIFLQSYKILPEELRLSEVEKALIRQLLNRKFGKLIQEWDDLTPGYITELVRRIRPQKSKKRIEERKKFVYKHAMKKLKQIFCNTDKVRFHPDNGVNFYQFYFGEIAAAKGIPIEHFFDPLNVKYRDKLFKTLSNQYLSLIFESEPFRKDFRDYLSDNSLVEDYQKAIPSKIEKLLSRWEEKLSSSQNSSQVLGDISKYFGGNKQCKLPWSLEEVTHAARSFEKFIP